MELKIEKKIYERKILNTYTRISLWISTIIFGVIANMSWDYGKSTRLIRLGFIMETCVVLKSFIFLLQATIRMITFSFAWKPEWLFHKQLTFQTWGKLLAVSFLGASANFLNAIGIAQSGSEVFAVFRLTRLPLVTFLRFLFFKDRPSTSAEWVFLLVIFLGALSFIFCGPIHLKGSFLGFIFMAAGCFFKGCAETWTEVFMRFDFKSLKLSEQQFIWAVGDVSSYCILIVLESYIEQRNWPPWEGMFLYIMPIVTVFALGFDTLNRLLITEYESALILVLLYVLIMLANWIVKLILDFHSVFNLARIPLLILLSASVLAYYNEESIRKKIIQ